MRNFRLILIIAILVVPHLLWAQSAEKLGLVLKGYPMGCAYEIGLNEKRYGCRRFRMTFENYGHEPIIIINPTLNYGTGLKEVVYYRSDGKSDVVRKSIEPRSSEIESFKMMVPLLDGERPAENMTIIIQPGDTFTFEENFQIDNDLLFKETRVIYERDRATNTMKKRIVINPVHFRTRLVYEYPFSSAIADADFLDKLSLKWSSFGRLPIGPTGTYTITSQPIK